MPSFTVTYATGTVPKSCPIEAALAKLGYTEITVDVRKREQIGYIRANLPKLGTVKAESVELYHILMQSDAGKLQGKYAFTLDGNSLVIKLL